MLTEAEGLINNLIVKREPHIPTFREEVEAVVIPFVIAIILTYGLWLPKVMEW